MNEIEQKHYDAINDTCFHEEISENDVLNAAKSCAAITAAAVEEALRKGREGIHADVIEFLDGMKEDGWQSMEISMIKKMISDVINRSEFLSPPPSPKTNEG